MPDPRIGTGSAPGTFGELLQGVLPDDPDDVDFLVTFPITRRTRAWFRLEPTGELRVYPAHKRKSLRLARMLLDAAGSRAGGTLVLDSELPVGKGLASSSADLVATVRAVGGVLGLDTSASAIEDWLRQIEPTDGVMHPGAVAFEHRRVRLRAVLGPLPALTVVAVDEGGQLDTVAFNRLPKPFSAPEKDEYAVLLDRLTDAVRTGDPVAIGAVATRSAVLNQRLAAKTSLDPMLAISADTGALGVVCAHSGTMLGVLLADDDPDHVRRLAQVRAACARLSPQVSLFRSRPIDEHSRPADELARTTR